MKTIFCIPKIILLLVMILTLSIHSEFSNFVMCYGEDGHVDLDVSIAENQSITLHHLTEHGEIVAYSEGEVFLPEKHVECCYDIIISFSAQFFDHKVKHEPAFFTALNQLFTVLSAHSFDILSNDTIKYVSYLSIPPPLLSYSSSTVPLLI